MKIYAASTKFDYRKHILNNLKDIISEKIDNSTINYTSAEGIIQYIDDNAEAILSQIANSDSSAE